MLGIIYAIIAGVAMSVQGVFNSRVGEKIGLWETNCIVQGSAFIITLIVTAIWGKGSFKGVTYVNKLYLLGGLIGVAITFTVMMSILKLGPTYSISIILVAQLLAAALIDYFGLFNSEKLSFGITKIIGLIVMIIGIIVFRWKN